jgi:hypothetical protein
VGTGNNPPKTHLLQQFIRSVTARALDVVPQGANAALGFDVYELNVAP